MERGPPDVAGAVLMMVLTATVRAWGEFNESKPSTWIFTIGLVLVIGITAGFYIFMERQRNPRTHAH